MQCGKVIQVLLSGKALEKRCSFRGIKASDNGLRCSHALLLSPSLSELIPLRLSQQAQSGPPPSRQTAPVSGAAAHQLSLVTLCCATHSAVTCFDKERSRGAWELGAAVVVTRVCFADDLPPSVRGGTETLAPWERRGREGLLPAELAEHGLPPATRCKRVTGHRAIQRESCPFLTFIKEFGHASSHVKINQPPCVCIKIHKQIHNLTVM